MDDPPRQMALTTLTVRGRLQVKRLSATTDIQKPSYLAHGDEYLEGKDEQEKTEALADEHICEA